MYIYVLLYIFYIFYFLNYLIQKSKIFVKYTYTEINLMCHLIKLTHLLLDWIFRQILSYTLR